jgi:hypothetical protein
MQLHDKTHCTHFTNGQVMQAHMIDNCSSLCSYSYRVAFKGRLDNIGCKFLVWVCENLQTFVNSSGYLQKLEEL